jgi:hypothetical protein
MIDVILQRHVEAFFSEVRRLGGMDNLSSPERAGHIVRAASAAGIVELKQDVSEMPPREVIELGAAVNAAIAEAIEIDPLAFWILQISLMEKSARLQYSKISGIAACLEAFQTLEDTLTNLRDCSGK